GDVKADKNSGGLIGQMVGGAMTRSYTTGQHLRRNGAPRDSTKGQGMLVGTASLLGGGKAVLRNVYYDKTGGNNISGSGEGARINSTDNVGGRTTAQLKQSSTFVGYNFGNASCTSGAWCIAPGQSNPALVALREIKYVDVATITGIKTRAYNGSALNSSATHSSDNLFDNPLVRETTGNLRVITNSKNAGVYSGDDLIVSGFASQQFILKVKKGSPALTIEKKALNANATVSNKTYDGNDVATGINTSLSGVIGSEVVSINTASASATFDSADAGTSKTVTVNGLTLTGADAFNYTLNAASTSADIDKKAINYTATASNKTYDGSDAATVQFSTLDLVGSDSVTFTAASSTFDNKNAGTDRAVTISGITLGGADKDNYSLASNANPVTADILKKNINYTVSASDKVYDGTDAATLQFNTLDIIGTEDVSFATTSAVFSDENAGVDKTVSIAGITLDGSGKSNYTLAGSTTASASATINKRSVVITGNVGNKQYDGNRNANNVTVTLGNYVAGDDISVDQANVAATFDDKHAGSNKAINVTGLVLSGNDANNYTGTVTVNSTAIITKKDLNYTALASNKVYDANKNAAVSFSSNDIVAGDTVNFATTSALFDTANAGTGKTVTVTGLNLTGADAANYNLVSNANPLTANIDKKDLSYTVAGQDRVYDGTLGATVQFSSDDIIGTDDVTFATTSVTFSHKHAAANKVVSVNGISLDGAAKDNYNLVSPVSTTTTATVTKRSVVINGNVDNKTYDGSRAATGVTVTIGNKVGSDDLFVDQSGVSAVFSDKNAGNNKAIDVTGLVLSGNDAHNYTGTVTVNSTATIGAKDLTYSAVGTNKTYNGNRGATVNFSSGDIISGDTVNIAAANSRFIDANAGVAKTVNFNGVSLTGADAGNYNLTSATAGTVTANIDRRQLNVRLKNQRKRADGTAYSGGNGYVINGFAAIDNESDLGGSLIYGGSAQGATGPGVYQIAGSGFTSGNYDFNYISGELRINGSNNNRRVSERTGVNCNTGLAGCVTRGRTVTESFEAQSGQGGNARNRNRNLQLASNNQPGFASVQNVDIVNGGINLNFNRPAYDPQIDENP
ncbi:MAG: beta strand repeat-containing protein, partial [Pseudomonadales bacterium]